MGGWYGDGDTADSAGVFRLVWGGGGGGVVTSWAAVGWGGWRWSGDEGGVDGGTRFSRPCEDEIVRHSQYYHSCAGTKPNHPNKSQF